MGVKYRAFVAASTGGPPVLSADPAYGGSMRGVVGTTELDEDEKESLLAVQDLLLKLRRKTVNFVDLPATCGSSGAEFSKAQLEKVWENLRLGHKYSRKKSDTRAFIFSADLFPPNVSLYGKGAKGPSISDSIRADTDRMKRVLEFIVQKRSKDDLILLFDGRSKACRRVFEAAEEKLAASGAHSITECWIVYKTPSKFQDPRTPARQSSFVSNNREVVLGCLPRRGTSKVVQRAEFNTCGETSTASTTYTGVPMRTYGELPRMDYDTKVSILGSGASGAVARPRVQKDIEDKGHPFSHCETKPLNLWQRICEHHDVTHIVDFCPGSGALAIAASGTIEYEGIACNDVHRQWLDATLDRCVMYLAGQNKDLARRLGGDDDFIAKVEKYLGGTMMEARRMLEPGAVDENTDFEESEDDEEVKVSA